MKRSQPDTHNSCWMLKITDEEFQLMRSLIYDRFGINLTEQKKTLLVGRLQKLIRTSGLTNFKEYYQYLINDRSGSSLSTLIDRISTNYTYFNRENDHFDFFREKLLPTLTGQLKKQNSLDLRIWCAGCSTGQEAYMLLMLVHDFLGIEASQWDTAILATDISAKALSIASCGSYREEQIKAIPTHLKRKYLRRQQHDHWVICDQLKSKVIFRRLNLMNHTFPFRKPFHIIFCRNVMIYFDSSTRERLIAKFNQCTIPAGYLFIGHAETLGRNQPYYKYLQPAVYKKRK